MHEQVFLTNFITSKNTQWHAHLPKFATANLRVDIVKSGKAKFQEGQVSTSDYRIIFCFVWLPILAAFLWVWIKHMSAVIKSFIEQVNKSKYRNIGCEQAILHCPLWEKFQRMGYLYK